MCLARKKGNLKETGNYEPAHLFFGKSRKPLFDDISHYFTNRFRLITPAVPLERRNLKTHFYCRRHCIIGVKEKKWETRVASTITYNVAQKSLHSDSLQSAFPLLPSVVINLIGQHFF